MDTLETGPKVGVPETSNQAHRLNPLQWREALAYEAGVTTGTLSLIERGQSNPAWGTVKAIAKALGVPMGDLARLADKFDT